MNHSTIISSLSASTPLFFSCKKKVSSTLFILSFLCFCSSSLLGEEPLNLESFLQRAIKSNSSLKASKMKVQQAYKQIKIARSHLYPSINLDLLYNVRDKAYTTESEPVAISPTIPFTKAFSSRMSQTGVYSLPRAVMASERFAP